MSEIAHVYQIKCKTNGKVYIGISDATVKSRLQRGISLLDSFTEPSNTNRGETNKEVIYVGAN